jgi:hypothetical protein
METRGTFVITLFCDPARSAELRGRVRYVVSNREATFRNLGELGELLQMLPGDDRVFPDNSVEEEGVR